MYEHSGNQGYVLSLINWPNTCSARNACPGPQGGTPLSFDEHERIELLAELE